MTTPSITQIIRNRCRCYVNSLSNHEQFMLRDGAHTQCCPVYRESRDPVDRINDRIAKLTYLDRLDLL